MKFGGTRGFWVGLLMAATAMVCSAQFFQGSPDTSAKVVALTGQVSVLRDSEPWALNVGDLVRMKQVIITGSDGYAKFEVSDGSTFEVYANSNVIFRKNPPSLGDLLDVFVGKVKVHIQKLGGQPNPNRVLTPTAVISVRGTTFEVSVNDDDDSTSITVEEGIVDVRHALVPGGGTKTLTSGETIRVYKNQPLAQSVIDKGSLARRIMHSLADAVYTLATNPSHGSTGTNPTTLPGQSPAPPPPPGPPPPPSGPPPGGPPH